MLLSRRRILTGLIAAPIVVTTPGLLMPIRAIEPWRPHWADLLASDNPIAAFVALYDASGRAIEGTIDWSAISFAAKYCDETVPA